MWEASTCEQVAMLVQLQPSTPYSFLFCWLPDCPESPHLLVGIFWPLVPGCRERLFKLLGPLRIFLATSSDIFYQLFFPKRLTNTNYLL